MELFAKLLIGRNLRAFCESVNYFRKGFILNVWQGSEYASVFVFLLFLFLTGEDVFLFLCFY